MQEVRVSIISTTPNMLDFLLAEERGFYSTEGLAVKRVFLAGEQAAEALAKGEVDFAIQIGAALKLVMTKGAELRLVLTIHRDPPHWMMGRPGVRSIQELKGKSVGSGGRGSDSSFLVERWLQQNGLQPGVDVQVTYHGSQPEWARGWFRMADDVPMAIPLEREILEARGWAPIAELGSLYPGLLSHGLMVSQSTIQKAPETIRKMIRAHRATARFIHEEPDAVIGYIQEHWKVAHDLAAKSYQDLARVFVAELDPKQVESLLDLTAQKLGMPALKLDAFWEPRFLRELSGMESNTQAQERSLA